MKRSFLILFLLLASAKTAYGFEDCQYWSTRTDVSDVGCGQLVNSYTADIRVAAFAIEFIDGSTRARFDGDFETLSRGSSMNLPKTVDFDSGDTIRYNYFVEGADGAKWELGSSGCMFPSLMSDYGKDIVVTSFSIAQLAGCQINGVVVWGSTNLGTRLSKANATFLPSGTGVVTVEEDELEQQLDSAEARAEYWKERSENCPYGIVDSIVGKDINRIDLSLFKTLQDKCVSGHNQLAERIEKAREKLNELVMGRYQFFESYIVNFDPVFAKMGFEKPFSQYMNGNYESIYGLRAKDEFQTENRYFDLYEAYLALIRDAISIRDYYEFVLSGFLMTDTYRIIGKDMTETDPTAQDQASYIGSSYQVEALLNSEDPVGSIDKWGYPESSKIPDEVKATIEDDIKPLAPVEAISLRDALRQRPEWNGDLTEKQERILLTVLALGQAFKSAVNASIDTVNKLKVIAQGAVQAATGVAICVSQTVAAGDYADWYEMVSGENFCDGRKLTIPERAASGLGLIAGSGLFWRGVGDVISGVAGLAKKGTKETISEMAKVEKLASDHGFTDSETIAKISSTMGSYCSLPSTALLLPKANLLDYLLSFIEPVALASTGDDCLSKAFEQLLASANDFGVPRSKIGDFAESASKSGMWAAGRRVGTDPATLLKSGKLDARDISEIIPEGTPNTWNPSSGTSFEKGFKYEWNHNGTRYHVHGHTIDPTAPAGSNAANGWTVRVRVGNRWLKTDGTTTRNTTLYGNETHIPFKPIME